jgi:hypothetical protein
MWAGECPTQQLSEAIWKPIFPKFWFIIILLISQSFCLSALSLPQNEYQSFWKKSILWLIFHKFWNFVFYFLFFHICWIFLILSLSLCPFFVSISPSTRLDYFYQVAGLCCFLSSYWVKFEPHKLNSIFLSLQYYLLSFLTCCVLLKKFVNKN